MLCTQGFLEDIGAAQATTGRRAQRSVFEVSEQHRRLRWDSALTVDETPTDMLVKWLKLHYQEYRKSSGRKHHLLRGLEQGIKKAGNEGFKAKIVQHQISDLKRMHLGEKKESAIFKRYRLTFAEIFGVMKKTLKRQRRWN